MQQLSEREALLCLNTLTIYGAHKLAELLNRYGTYAGIWYSRPPEQKNKVDLPFILNELQQQAISWITFLDPEYPPLLKEISSPPIVLYYQGDRSLLQTPSLGVVGTRKASSYGEQVINVFIPGLVTAGLTIISGFQKGIDTLAHTKTIQSEGKTIAVLGTGIDLDYPNGNRKLKEQIKSTGLILSEYPPGTPPLKQNFPRRNRIISGLSFGVLVVEAARKSGSLITANFAVEQNREVFAIPGSIISPLSEGPHYLIEQGARLVYSPIQIYESIGIPQIVPVTPTPAGYRVSPVQEKILANLDVYGKPFDRILKETELNSAELSAQLTLLEIEGLVNANGNGIYSKTRP